MADLQQMERKGACDMDGLAGTHDLKQLPAWGPYITGVTDGAQALACHTDWLAPSKLG